MRLSVLPVRRPVPVLAVGRRSPLVSPRRRTSPTIFFDDRHSNGALGHDRTPEEIVCLKIDPFVVTIENISDLRVKIRRCVNFIYNYLLRRKRGEHKI